MSTVTIKHLDSLFKEFLEPGSRIVGHTIQFLVEPGNNFGSIILLLDVMIKQHGSAKQLRTIAKCPTKVKTIRTIIHVDNSVANELQMYKNYVPGVTAFQKECGIPEGNLIESMFPKFYCGRLDSKGADTVDEDSVIVLENMRTYGYRMGDRLIGYDLEESLFILKRLARFHAAGVALKILKPEEFAKLKRFVPALVFSEEFQISLMRYARQLKEFYGSFEDLKQYAEKVAELTVNTCNFPEKSHKPGEPFATVVHNDFWVNNILLLKENKKLTDIKIIDFQFSLYGSPSQDVLFFCYSSLNIDVLQQNLDTFLDYHYDNFIEYLKEYKLDIGPFTREAYREDLDVVAPLEFGHIIHTIKAILTDNDKVKRVSLSHVGMYRFDILTTEFFKRAENLLREYVKRGWLK